MWDYRSVFLLLWLKEGENKPMLFDSIKAALLSLRDYSPKRYSSFLFFPFFQKGVES